MSRRKTIFGLLTVAMAAFVSGAAALALVDITNDAEPSTAERLLGTFLFELKSRSHRPQASARGLPTTEEDLIHASGMYEQMCAICHGAARGKTAPFANSFAPRPPQFVIAPSSGPTWRDAYVIRHGIRWTGMPSFQGISEADAWHLALYVEGRTELRE